MSFSVTKSSPFMVRPAGPTPSGKLELSAIDKLPGLRCKVRTFHVFSHGSSPGKVISEAASKALLHYYPLAGRLVESGQLGELQVDCTGDGIWFVKASADCTLLDVNHLSHPLVPNYEQLLPDPRPELDPANILVLMQVTEFKCGGFAIGLEFCHSVCDGLGAAQFLRAVGEFARGLPAPLLEPVWLREAIPTPPKLGYVQLLEAGLLKMPVPSYKLEQATVDVTLEHVSAAKSRFFELMEQRCSVFEALAAKIWQRRTAAINFDPDVHVKLVFFANARRLVHPAPLPEGFYGNCFFPVTVSTPAGRLVGKSEVEVVDLIKEAKARLPEEFAGWMAGEVEEDPYVPSLEYTTLFVSEWSRLGFGEVDYGWGTAVQVVPITYSDVIPVCILAAPPAPKKGVRLITQCVDKIHFDAFWDLMMNEATI